MNDASRQLVGCASHDLVKEFDCRVAVAPGLLGAGAEARHPTASVLARGEMLRLGQPHKVPGFDLTFRAPKSVSVLFGLGEPDTARQVRDAHDRAVESALEFAERHKVWSRRGRGGVTQVRGEGLIAAAFRHRTSRNGDPHLHTHLLVPNMVLGEDGKWATLDARWLYTSAKTIGYLYEAQLRSAAAAELERGVLAGFTGVTSEDVPMCLEVDRFDFAMRAIDHGAYLTLTRADTVDPA